MSWLPGFERGRSDGANGDDWYTPPFVLAWLPPIDLDPCYAEGSSVVATHMLDVRRGDDGLTDPWPGDGLVWSNHPFSRTKAWLSRCRREGQRRVVVALTPAVPADNPWQVEVWGKAAWVGFIAGRLDFFDSEGNTETKGRGHALLIYGPRQQANAVRDHIMAAAVQHPQAPWWVPGNWDLRGKR